MRDAKIFELCTPCGGCRQRIAEFANAETEILLRDKGGAIHQFDMAGLLPASFRLK